MPSRGSDSVVEPVCEWLAANLHTLLKRKGVTVRQLARVGGVSRETLRNATRGDGVSLDALDRIAILLQVTAATLVREDSPLASFHGENGTSSAMALTQRLRQCRREFDVEEIEERSGVPRSTVYRILEKETDVHIRRVAQLAHGLGRKTWCFISAPRRHKAE